MLPSNTLTCLYGLTEDVRQRGVLGSRLHWQIKLIDETVQRVDVPAILRRSRRRDTKTIVCLVGVQSNQFARANDLAMEFRKGKIDVLIGGFHVSGSLAMLPELPSEIKALLDAGVSVVAGEIEGRWEAILRDAVDGKLNPIYNFLREPPALQAAPLPRISKPYAKRFVSPNFSTLDCGRGCPFNCSFCTVINVQGRVMRFRDVERLLQAIRENYHHHRIGSYFFTDDNFCRNKYWEAILDGLIRLRQEEGIHIGFMVQADTQSYKLLRFIEKAKAAGCSQVFIGLESLNPKNLEAAGKRQNKLENFRALFEAYRQAGINTHAAYIIGFPFDTLSSVRQDIDQLIEDLGPEQASFFMLTPLPGSQDHSVLVRQGVELDADLNRYDSFHATTRHPKMSREEWTQAYNEAWKRFYSLKNMKRILWRVNPENYWAVFANFIWYKNSWEVEQGHPMIHGFVRLKARKERRPGFPIESPWRYLKHRLCDFWRYARLWPRLALEMEEVWLQTRKRSVLEQRVVEELQRLPSSVRGWRRMRVSEIQHAYQQAVGVLYRNMPHVPPLSNPIPSRLLLWLKRWNPCSHSLTWTRRSMQRFWKQSLIHLRQGRIHYLDITGVVFNGIQELSIFITFASLFFSRLLIRLFARTVARV
ncbi:MAG: radical SAM protein [Candidatus Omnitrophica bacterium]|nr:radical SAM protein [Candidatus Omnitrophota bacterium]